MTDSETEVCHWCGDEITPDPVLWDIQEEDNRDAYYRYRFCSESCKDATMRAGPEGENHTQPERLRASNMEEIHR